MAAYYPDAAPAEACSSVIMQPSMRRESLSDWAGWLVVVALSVVEAGAYIGNESGRYLWDLTSYVEALDNPYPYRDQRTYPFLYPPFSADLFTLTRSHLFELLSIAYVAAAVVFLASFARIHAPRRFEWLFAMTAIGGLGIVSLQSGNVAILMNLGLLAVAYQATQQAWARRLLPAVIAFGALLKPQFAIYLLLLPVVERNWRAAVAKIGAAAAGIAVVYGLYMMLRPADWNEYIQAIAKRTIVEKDFGWGPSGFIKHWSDNSVAMFGAYIAGLVIVGALALQVWWRSARPSQPVVLSLAFIALTFANPRLPLYDVYAAAIALAVVAACARTPPAVPAVALTINIVPWGIKEFARTPSAWPWWLQDLQIEQIRN